jgi:dipicolinate synthase subunit B
VYIALSTNDGLSGSHKNIAILQNMKNFIFIPYEPDDKVKKPFSLSFVEEEVESCLA